MIKGLLLAFTVIFLLSGCADMANSLTPGVKVTKSEYDGTIEIIQASVSSSNSLSEAFHTLGFRWNEMAPEKVYLTVGVYGIGNVTGVAFNADGNKLENIQTASNLTEYGDWSTRQFVMPLDDFKILATASDVKMKVSRIDKYTVSSFGQANTNAAISGKFLPFLARLNEIKK
jgi:hypothetical protein